MEYIFFITLFFIFGITFGSFFNVVGYRLPNNMSLIKPDSHCPNCKHRLSPLELIPIFSYLIQGGRCKNCKKKIPIFYPIFEFLTGILFVVCYLVFGFDSMLIISLVFVSTLLITIISDIKYMIIPDELIIFSGLTLFFLRIFLFGFSINIIIDMIVPFLLMLLIKLFGDFVFKKESMGGGDIKLMLIFGLAIGWQMAIFSIFLASFIAFPFSLFLLIRKKEHILPFGPYLSIAAIIILFFQLDIDFVLKLLIR